MIDRKKNYWFYLESYIYSVVKRNEMLLINTLDGKKIFSIDPIHIKIIKSIYDGKNGGVIKLNSSDLENDIIFNFVNRLRNNYFADIIDVETKLLKPFQFTPKLSIQKVLQSKYTSGVIKEDITAYLREVNIHIDRQTLAEKYIASSSKKQSFDRKEMTLEMLSFILNQTSNTGISVIQILGDNVWKYSNYIEFLDLLSSVAPVKIINTDYLDLDRDKIKLLPFLNFKLRVFVNFPLDVEKWNLLKFIYFNGSNEVEVTFLLESMEDMKLAQLLIGNDKIDNYSFEVIYTGKNIAFFKKSVFLNKKDIISAQISMNEIFVRQTLNAFDFGKIDIFSNGEVYANLYRSAIGNIRINNIHELLYNEINNGKSWLYIRNQKPCKDCIFQWLCPSPSNYELIIGRPNLCNVKNN